MSDPVTAPPMDPTLRELAKVLHERYTLAARIARATWPAEETSPEAMVAASATVFIEINKQLAGHGTPAAGSPNLPNLSPPVCTCGATMAPVTKTNPKMPDWRCPACDKARWNRDRQRRNGAQP